MDFRGEESGFDSIRFSWNVGTRDESRKEVREWVINKFRKLRSNSLYSFKTKQKNAYY